MLFFVIIALAIWGFDRFYYTPQRQKISKLKEEIKGANSKLSESLLLTQGIEALETEVSRLEKELGGINQRTLRGEEFKAFLRHLAKDCDRLQIKVVSLTPQEEKIPLQEGKKAPSAFHDRKIAVQIVLHSTYVSLGNYLRGIEGLSFPVTLDHLQVERDEEILPFLKVTMGLTVHVIS